MPFPECSRVIYKKNPLVQVICQLRFPPILSINSKEPFELQDAIREYYPLYEEQLEHLHQITIKPDGGDLKNPLPTITQASVNKNHRFSSEDNSWHINLTRTFIALSTTEYVRWEEFLFKLREPFEGFINIYKPVFFDRIGLRFINVFCRSKLGLDDKWSELIQPYALGLLSAEAAITDKIRLNNTNTELILSDENSIAKITTSIGKPPNSSDDEECFIVDNDFYTLGKHIGDVFEKLDYLHDRSTRLLRWIIKDKLHNAMEPVEL